MEVQHHEMQEDMVNEGTEKGDDTLFGGWNSILPGQFRVLNQV